jgi:hypothetical protein
MNRSLGLLLCATALAFLATAGAEAQPYLQSKVTQAHPVCLKKADAYQLAAADVAGTSATPWEEFVAEGKCAMVPATYLFTLETTMADELSRVVEYSALGNRVWGLMTKLPSNVWQVRYDPEWENSPPLVRKWFQELMQPDNPGYSCCGEADSYEADLYEQDGESYIAIITGQGPAVNKLHIPEGTRLRVPTTKIKWDKGNPTGHGIIFVGRDYTIYCYVPPAGL